LQRRFDIRDDRLEDEIRCRSRLIHRQAWLESREEIDPVALAIGEPLRTRLH
jgi:hypothetical protein